MLWAPGHLLFFFSSRRRHTRFDCDWSSDVCSSDLTWRAPSSRAPIWSPRTRPSSPSAWCSEVRGVTRALLLAAALLPWWCRAVGQVPDSSALCPRLTLAAPIYTHRPPPLPLPLPAFPHRSRDHLCQSVFYYS